MITLYLMSYKGYKVLSHIIELKKLDLIEFVVLGRDANVKNDYFNDLKSLCERHNIVYKSRKDKIPITPISIAISWRWLINDKNTKLIVIHDSLLPKYRGFAPIVSALLNKEKNIGVTALLGTKNYDEGDILLQKLININYPIKVNEVIEKVSVIYTEIIEELLLLNLLDKNHGTPQIESEATYSIWRDEIDYLIDWTKSAADIQTLVNSVGYPYLGASTYMNGKKIRISDVEIKPDVIIEHRNTSIGKIIFLNNGIPTIICGDGLIQIKKAYIDGEKEDIYFKNFRTRFHNTLINEL